MEQTRAALLLLSDGRLPAGGYAHSGTLEPLIRSGRVNSVDELARFLEGRAETAGFVAATVAACACHYVSQDDFAALTALESEFEARTPAEELRSVSRRLGRQLLRVMSTIRPHPFFEKLSGVQHQPVIMGVAAAALELSPRDAALALLYETVSIWPSAPFHESAVLSPLPGPGVVINAVATDSLALRDRLQRGLEQLGEPWAAR